MRKYLFSGIFGIAAVLGLSVVMPSLAQQKEEVPPPLTKEEMKKHRRSTLTDVLDAMEP